MPPGNVPKRCKCDDCDNFAEKPVTPPTEEETRIALQAFKLAGMTVGACILGGTILASFFM